MHLRFASAVVILALSAPTFGITALSIDDPSLQGTTVGSGTFTIDTQDPGDRDTPPVPVLFVDEKIIQNGAGTLDFYFKLRNVSEPQPLLGFRLSYAPSIQASAFYLDEGNLAPAYANLYDQGSFVSAVWGFGADVPIIGPEIGAGGTDTLLLRTNAIGYISGDVGAIRHNDDFELQPGEALIPDASSVPEPRGLSLLSVAIAGLAMRFRRYSWDRS